MMDSYVHELILLFVFRIVARSLEVEGVAEAHEAEVVVVVHFKPEEEVEAP